MIVRFTLQGDGKRIDKAIAAIDDGTKRSTGVGVSAIPSAIEPDLKTFTIVDWTSFNASVHGKHASAAIWSPTFHSPFGTWPCPTIRRGVFGVPSMIDSLEVKVLHPA
jgi:hypothetical protein